LKLTPPISLKDCNRWPLWLTITVNFSIFYAVAQTDAIEVEGLKGLMTGVSNLLPVGIALIVTSILNGLLDANMKARLVFLRWRHALPGHRAFTKYAVTDPRVDIGRLRPALGQKLPDTPEDQNRIWYRIYKEMEKEPAVADVHRDFLFARDYTAFALLFLIGFGVASFFLVESRNVALVYAAGLLAQFLLVRQAAATHGVRFVTTVLARKSAQAAKR
jgi:hypothetical protein